MEHKDFLHSVALDDAERAHIAELLTVSASGEHRGAWLAAFGLPAAIREAVYDLRYGSSHSVVHIRNLPLETDRLPPTPTDEAVTEIAEATGLLCMVGAMLGEPVAFNAQQHGRIINDVRPLAQFSDVGNINAGSTHAFGLHTEDAFHPCRPDYLLLFCLRNTQRAPVTVSTVRQISETAFATLSRPNFRIRANPSQGGGAVYTNGCAVLSGPAHKPTVRLNTPALLREDYTAEQLAALDELLEELTANTTGIALEPGDMVILDNHRVVHGRERFEPRFDGTDRWLKRLTVLREPRLAQPYRVPGSATVVLDRLPAYASLAPLQREN